MVELGCSADTFRDSAIREGALGEGWGAAGLLVIPSLAVKSDGDVVTCSHILPSEASASKAQKANSKVKQVLVTRPSSPCYLFSGPCCLSVQEVIIMYTTTILSSVPFLLLFFSSAAALRSPL